MPRLRPARTPRPALTTSRHISSALIRPAYQTSAAVHRNHHGAPTAGLAPTGAALAKLIPELHPGAHLVRIAETTPGHYDITVKFPGTIEHACTGPLADGTHDRLQHTTATLPT